MNIVSLRYFPTEVGKEPVTQERLRVIFNKDPPSDADLARVMSMPEHMELESQGGIIELGVLRFDALVPTKRANGILHAHGFRPRIFRETIDLAETYLAELHCHLLALGSRYGGPASNDHLCLWRGQFSADLLLLSGPEKFSKECGFLVTPL